MKRFLVILATFGAVAFTSCLNSSDDFVGNNFALVSVVDGDAFTGQYLIFDDGQRVSVASGMEFLENVPASKYYPSKENGEARAEVAYRVNKNTLLGFDATVNVQSLSVIDAKRVDTVMPSDIEDYDADIKNILGATYAREKWINIFPEFACSGQGAIARHKFYLVRNTERTGFFAPAYKDDSYLYLELYHDDDNDTMTYSGGKWISFYLTDELLGEDISLYSGIKILYRKDGAPEVMEFKFK